ncbi:4'-phosphopantetheinyl transferase superfamily protein [Streptomyces sp. NPDC008150]|uniref:4'-phosphopantetheinyl transferase family protein n=1 Tax=Streptomyces sp. NPDC008150 TaxID=3364816 RepID=UPI0036E92C00
MHLWRVPLTGSTAQEALALAPRVLAPDELARAARLLTDVDRRRWTAARVALRAVLAHCTGTPPDRVTLAYGRHGKPRLPGPGRGALRFSLTHSRDLALLAVCRGAPVGADLEHLTAGPPGPGDLDDLAAAVLAPPELRAYRLLPPELRRAALLRRWTGKEAVLKATGRGVTVAAARRVVVPDGSGTPRGLPGHWTLLRPSPGGPFTAAVAVLGKDWTVVRTDFTGVTPEGRARAAAHVVRHRPALSGTGGAAARHG